MRTGRALTVSVGRGGGCCIPEEILGEKFEKKEKKFEKKNLETPQKIGDTPLKNWRPPEKLETPKKLETPPRDQTIHPLLTESQTRVKILPWPNFVAAGNYNSISQGKQHIVW